MPLISLIIPVYNVEQYLTKCVDSVLAQTCGGFEVILVDDGSTDSSGVLCDRYAAAHPQLIRVIHQENAGLGGARNTGIDAARGDYLLFVDSDDFVSPELTEQMMPFAQAGTDMVIFGAVTVDTDGRVLEDSADGYPENTELELSGFPELIFGWPSACIRMYKKTLFTDTGVRFPSRVWYEDIRTTTKLYTHARHVRYLAQNLYFYLNRPGSITKNANVARNREIIDAFEDILDFYRNSGLFEQYYPQLEYLALYHLYTAASVRVLRIDPRAPLLGELRRWMQTHFPDFRKNRYIGRMTGTKRLAFRLVDMKMYRTLRLLFKIKDGQ